APSATWPWASDRLRGEQPRVLVGERIDVETVAALQPDLIVAVSAGLDQQQYDTFSRLAPTIAHPVGADPFQAAWQDTARLIGAALGRAEEAGRMVADLEARCAAVREQYPQFQGRRAAIAAASSTGTGYFVWASDDNRGRFLTSLGFTVPPVFDELAGDSSTPTSATSGSTCSTRTTSSAGSRSPATTTPPWTPSPATRRCGSAGKDGWSSSRRTRASRCRSAACSACRRCSTSCPPSSRRTWAAEGAPAGWGRIGAWERTSSTSWSGAA